MTTPRPQDTSAPLVARSRAVDGALDLTALVGRDGLLVEREGTGLAGRGQARSVAVHEVDRALASMQIDDQVMVPGSGPVAFGALPFTHSGDAMMIVPEIVWGRDAEGRCWVTTIGPSEAGDPSDRIDLHDLTALCTPPVLAPIPAPQQVTATPVRDAAWWCALVARATSAMRAAGPDGLRKVVLAREVLLHADQPFDRQAVLQRLRDRYPGCFVFHVDGFLGASPELLVSRHGDVVRAQPMAGTAPRSDNPSVDAQLGAALLASPTYRHEHQITIDMVYDTLLPWCSYLDYEAEPSVVGVANVQHLATLVEGRLSQPAPSVLDLVDALHPTPAVNGWPRELAQTWITDNEGFDRGRYAGAVGWVDSAGNGTWAVSIRCADIAGTTARLCAGNGIVPDSDPDTELAETEAKLAAMRSALSEG